MSLILLATEHILNQKRLSYSTSTQIEMALTHWEQDEDGWTATAATD